MRYYEPDAGWFVNQDPIGLWGGITFISLHRMLRFGFFVKTLEPAGDCKVGLHEPDMRTGGKLTDVTKVGDKRINLFWEDKQIE